jgi:hypothetical protein
MVVVAEVSGKEREGAIRRHAKLHANNATTLAPTRSRPHPSGETTGHA